MPLFKGRGCKAKPNKALAYILNQDKAVIISSQSLDDNRSYTEQFRETCKQYGKGDGFDERKYYHFKFSCDPVDHVSPEQSHALVEQLAAELFPGYECVIATHNDTDIIHSHIIVNAVNYVNGYKLQINNHEYRAMKDRANSLAVENNLTPLDWRKATRDKRVRMDNEITGDSQAYSQPERYMMKEHGVEWSKSSWKDTLRKVIDEAKNCCTNRLEFERYLKDNYGVEMPRNTERTVSFIHPAVRDKAVRGVALGNDYTSASIDQALQMNNERMLHNAELRSDSAKQRTDQGGTPAIPATRTDELPAGFHSDRAVDGSRGAAQAGNGKQFTETSLAAVERELRRIDENVKSFTGTSRNESPERCPATSVKVKPTKGNEHTVHRASRRRAEALE